MKSEDKKNIGLLLYSLDMEKVDSSSYFIAFDSEIDRDDCKILRYIGNNEWITYYSERGIRNSIVKFSSGHDAIRYFFWILTKPRTPWYYRERYEAEILGGSKSN